MQDTRTQPAEVLSSSVDTATIAALTSPTSWFPISITAPNTLTAQMEF